MSGAVERSIDWGIYEELLEEAAWLWTAWEEAMDSPVYTVDEVVDGPEERLHAQLDALVLGGAAVAERLLLPALGGDEIPAAVAAAWALLQAEEGDHQEAVVDRLKGAPPPLQGALARAFALAPRADLGRLMGLWREGTPPLRGLVLDVLRQREPEWARGQLELALRDPGAPLQAAALRAFCQLPDRRQVVHVEACLRAQDPAVRAEAVAAGVVLGSKQAWETCRAEAALPGPAGRRALGLLATSREPRDREQVLARARGPEPADAIWALGFAGEVGHGDALVAMLSEDELAPLAAEALAAITGVAIVGPLARPAPRGPDVADDAPAPVLRPTDQLPFPNAPALADWWARQRSQLRPGVRHVRGQPVSAEVLQSALRSAPTWRRRVHALELGVSGGAIPDLDGWARADRAAALARR